MDAKKILMLIASVLVVVGAVNWGLEALGFNLVTALLGVGIATNILYGLVAISGIAVAPMLFKKKA